LGRYRFSAARAGAYTRDLTPAQLTALTHAVSEPLARRGYA
jgi:hypothetical protein